MINTCEMCDKIIRENHFHYADHIYHAECAEAMGLIECPACGMVYDSTHETHDCSGEENE